MKTELFSDLKIIELANVLAGPSVGMFFAELGATVIKVENTSTGDVTRTWKTRHEDEDKLSAYFTSVNWGKTFRQLNLKDEQDYAELVELVKDTDIVITSYKYGDDVKLSVDYETLKAINPKLIYGQITGYGRDVDRTGYDALIQAESGFMSMNGEPDSKPTKMPVALMDILAAHQLKEAILVALINRMKTGEGDHVHVSLIDAAISSLANQASNYLMTNHVPQQMGSEHPNIVPYGSIYPTKDHKYLILAIGTDKQFSEFCNILDIPNIAEDERFKHNPDRVKHRDELNHILAESIKSHESESLVNRCLEQNIPAGVVKSLDDVFSEHENLVLDKEGKRAVRTVAFTSEKVKTRMDLGEPD